MTRERIVVEQRFVFSTTVLVEARPLAARRIDDQCPTRAGVALSESTANKQVVSPSPGPPSIHSIMHKEITNQELRSTTATTAK